MQDYKSSEATEECSVILTKSILYSSGYKYQLKADYQVHTDVVPDMPWEDQFCSLDVQGVLTVRSGYAFDGPSGPTIDTKSFMRGALVHDVLYQILRHGGLPKSYKDLCDRMLQRICVEDGMFKLRAWYVYQGVKMFGYKSLTKDSIKQQQVAP